MTFKPEKTLNTKLADSLKRVKDAATKEIVQSSNISRIDRERLIRHGYLHKIIKGWYFLARFYGKGESIAWYACYWDFLSLYLPSRFNEKYCLSAESSLKVYTASNTIPKQIIVITETGGQSRHDLPHDTSIFLYADKKNLPDKAATVNGLNLMPLPLSLCRVSPSFFIQNQIDAEIGLGLTLKGTEISKYLIRYPEAAKRIVGAYLAMGYKEKAEEVSEHLKNAGYKITPVNPFQSSKNIFPARTENLSPYAARIELLWKNMREQVISVFPDDPGIPKDTKAYLSRIDDIYINDSYHSLSIEGYKISHEMIEKIRLGQWDPDSNPDDFQQSQALAAKGYLNAFNAVKESINQILNEKSPGNIIETDLQKWYQSLFSPFIETGSIKNYDLIGYRNDPVYIKSSMHVPPPCSAVTDSMNAFFSLIKSESKASVRAILGHFIFTYIHPYMDGNGRIARFLMNAMLASGGFVWTIIRMENRDEYMNALESASIEKDIKPFAEFVLKEMKVEWVK